MLDKCDLRFVHFGQAFFILFCLSIDETYIEIAPSLVIHSDAAFQTDGLQTVSRLTGSNSFFFEVIIDFFLSF